MVLSAVVREPLKLKPILQSRVWGGDGLHRLLGKGDGQARDIGESWELSDREGNSTAVACGTFAGLELRELFSRHARDLLGVQYTPAVGRFPLLYKFIHASQDLSVQVHPGEGSSLGEAKSECWYVLDAPPGAGLLLGLAVEGDQQGIVAALASRACLTVLNRLPVKAGDTFYIPAGTVHAITPGLLLYEVQQNSDTTFRLYDWDRRDAAGKTRPLHVQESAQVIDFRKHDNHRIRPLALPAAGHGEEMLVACRHFALARFTGCAEAVTLRNGGRFRVITCMRGSFEIGWDGGPSLAMALGETVLIPAACAHPRLRETAAGSEAIVSFVPQLEEEVVKPLRAAGHSPEAIRQLGGIDGIPV